MTLLVGLGMLIAPLCVLFTDLERTTALILRALWLAWKDRRAQHRRIARWAYPIWLYVSVTGVVVYWMLYHLAPSLS